jgi:uncharacterized protein YbaP (TraB family)
MSEHDSRTSVASGLSRTWRRTTACFFVAVLSFLAVDDPHAATRNLLWKVSNQAGTIYLAGSMHLLAKDSYPLSAALDTAFAESTLLVEEIDYNEMVQPASQLLMLSRGMLPADQRLEALLTPETLALTEKRLATSGLPVGPLKLFKPWMIALTLMSQEWQKAGFETELGLDKHFYDRAKAAKKPVQALETLEFQIGQFDAMTAGEQDRLLASTIRELDTQISALNELAAAWKSGDTATLERLLLRDLKAEARLYDQMVVGRNRTWLPKIEELFFRGTPAFVVVGAAHLIGPDGLVAMLQAKGYTVEQQ